MHICMYKASTAANVFESLKNETTLLRYKIIRPSASTDPFAL